MENEVISDDIENEKIYVERQFQAFLQKFSTSGGCYDYLEQLRIMKENSLRSLYINWAHFGDFDARMALEVERNYYKYEPILKKVLQLVYRNTQMLDDRTGVQETPVLWINFYNLPSILKLRDLKSKYISKLRAFCGTVTRTSEVRPELLFASFFCLDCQKIQPLLAQNFCYVEPRKCVDESCNNNSRWQLDLQKSQFVDWQKIRVQENSDEIPSGSMPRHIDLILRNDAVEKAKAGDKCIFVGTLVAVPDVSVMRIPGSSVTSTAEQRQALDGIDQGLIGLKDTGVRDLNYKLTFIATVVMQNNGSGTINMGDIEDEKVELNDIEKELVWLMRRDHHLYTNLSRSLAPSIFGHDEVKKGLLLMLLGGVHKQTAERIQLRGDINVCIVGDPSVAKSQFLKYILGLVPRTVYTSGKASTAAGLTATVVRDNETGEYNIEAGALMLADSGICCIDEFDKMDSADQVAIHEAMEQQTISIAKAGIHATLNARTSILAAANPIGGRYDKSRSLKANLAITPAIISRFDLLFVVLDKNDPNVDFQIANHIVKVHQNQVQSLKPVYSQKQMQTYIKYAKTVNPQFSPESQDKLVEEYCKLRISDQGKGKTSWRITVRQLESMIRLSEALARLNLQEKVTVAFVEEASRLLRQSIINVYSDDVEIETDLGLVSDIALDSLELHSDLPIKAHNLTLSKHEKNFDAHKNPEKNGNSNTNGNNKESILDYYSDDENTNNLVTRNESKSTNGNNSDNNNNNNNNNDDDDNDDAFSKKDTNKSSKTSDTKKKVKISREKYEKIKNLIILIFCRNIKNNPDDQTMVQKDLVAKYLDENAEKILGHDDLKYQKLLVTAVINKMIKSEKILHIVKESKPKELSLLSLREGLDLDIFGL